MAVSGWTGSQKYPCESLRKDEEPYVRKTAAVSVAKLHDINATLVEEQVRLYLLRMQLFAGTVLANNNKFAGVVFNL